MSHFFQGFLYELGLVLGNDQFHIRRETGFRILQHFPDFRYRFNGIGIRSQGNRIYYRLTAYALIQEQRNRGIHTFAFVNVRNILQLQNLAILGANNDITEFFRGLQTALGAGRVFKFQIVGGGFGTDGTNGGLDVLCLNRCGNIGCSQPQLSHQVRLQFHTHGVFRAVFTDGRHAFNTLNRVYHVRSPVGFQEHAVVGFVGRRQYKIHNRLGRHLGRGNTVLGNLGRHGGLGLVYTVLHFYRGNVTVLFQVEVNI